MLLRPNVTRPNVIRRKCTRRNVTEPIYLSNYEYNPTVFRKIQFSGSNFNGDKVWQSIHRMLQETGN